MRGRGKMLAAVALGAVAIVAFVVFGLAPSKTEAPGRKAPGLPSEHLAGPAVTMPRLLADAHGRPSLVVFWASWCDPCASEAPALEAFSRTPQGRGRIVGVDWSDPRSGAVAFIHRYGWTFPTVRDGEGLVGNEYGMTDLPTTFVIDGAGKIAATLRGPQTEASLGRALHSAERA